LEVYVTQERRLRKRINLSVYLAAADAATGVALGKIIDINAAGFLLLTDASISLAQKYSLTIALPEPINQQKTINCNAVACRISPSANPSFSEVGFDIIYATTAHKAIIELLQEKWRLNFPAH
jgi:hypothetical protein